MEREDLLIDLKCREVHEKQLLLDRKELEERIRQQLKTKLELENQLKEIQMERLQRKEEEDQFRTVQLELLAEQDRLEILTKEKQRAKKHEHYRLVREMLAAREAARNAQLFDLVREHNELIVLEKRRFVQILLAVLMCFCNNIMAFLIVQTRNLCFGTDEDTTAAC